MKRVKIIALLSALITAALLFVFLNQLDEPVEVSTQKVITASVDIPSNTTITESMLSAVELPEQAVLQNALKDQELAVGKTANSSILTGEQILSDKLVTPGGDSNETLAYAIDPQMRAITIAVDAVKGISGMLKPRDHVDLLADFEVEDKEGNTISYTTLLAEDLTVLAVDHLLREHEVVIDEESPGGTYATITVQATPKQAMEISFGEYNGQLRAILRSPLDDKLTQLPEITLSQLLAD